MEEKEAQEELKKENKKLQTNKKSKIKIIFEFFIFPLIIIAIFASSVFGMIEIAKKDSLNQSDKFKNKYEVQIHVDNLDPNNDKDIYYISDYYQNQLLNLGIKNSKITILDDNDLLVDFPIDSIINIKDDKFSLDTQKEYIAELVKVEGTLLNTSNVEFRSYTGDLLFDYSDSGNDVIFYPPPEPDDGTETTKNNLYEQKDGSLYNPYEIRLIDHAELDYVNGNPYVNIFPKENYRSLFQQAIEEMNSLYDEETNPQANIYSVWFNYDLFKFLASEFDSEVYGEANATSSESGDETDPLIKYIYYNEYNNGYRETPRDVSKPFFITRTTIAQSHSAYSDSYAIYGNFSKNEAKAIVNKINFSTNNFLLETVDQHFILENNNFTIMIVLYSIFFLIILIVSFTFVWWFGLLGLITVIATLIPGLIIISIISLLAIPIGLSLLIGLSIAYLVLINNQYKLLSIYINNDLNKDNSYLKKFRKNMRKFIESTGKNTFVIFTIIALSALFFTINIQYFLLFIIFTLGVNYILFFLLWGPLLFVLDILFKFTYTEEKRKDSWTIIVGKRNNPFSKNISEVNDKINQSLAKSGSKKFTILTLVVSLLIIIIGLGTFTILKSTGNNINTSFLNDKYYQYNVVRDITLSESDTFGEDSNDFYNQEELIDEIKRNEDQIIDAFEDNDIKIKSTRIIKNEEYSIDDFGGPNSDNLEYEFSHKFSYGLTLYSNDAMSLEQYQSISTSLEEITDISIVEYKPDSFEEFEPPKVNYEFHFELLETGSLTNIETNQYAQEISNYSFESTNIENIAFIFLFAAIIIIVLTIYFNWAIAFTIFTSLLLEILVATSLLVIFYVPFSLAFMGILITSIIVSILSKISSIKKEKKEWIYNKRKNLIPSSMLSILFILNIFGVIIFGIEMLVVLIYLIFFQIMNFIVEIFIFPKYLNWAIKAREDEIENKRFKDEKWAEDSKNISEEYIKGINK